MIRYPFTGGKIEYIEDKDIRKQEILEFLKFWHPDSFGENNPVDILFGIKKIYTDPKTNKPTEYWSQGFFNNALSKEPTIDSLAALGEKGKKANTLTQRPNIDAHYNIYVSAAEYPAGTGNSKIENVSRLPGAFFDLDVHDVSKEIVDTMVPLMLKKIINASNIGVLPRFNIINLTGAGLALFLKYEKPVSAKNDRCLGFHKALWEKICTVMEELFSKDAAFYIGGKCVIEVDRSVKNINRNCRIPGTYHSCKRFIKRFATMYSIDRECKSLEEHCRHMAVKDPEVIIRKDEKVGKVKLDDVEYDHIIEVDPTRFNSCAKNCAKRRLEQLEELIMLRGGKDGDKRHNAVRLYWNYSRMLYDVPTCIRLLLRFNNELSDPLGEAFITFVTYSPYYVVVGEDFAKFLSLTTKEIEKLKLFKRRDKKKRALENARLLPEKIALVKALWEEGELSVAEISQRCDKSASTIREWAEKYGWISAEERKELKKQKTKEKRLAKRKEQKELDKAAKELIRSSKKAEKTQKSKTVSILEDFGVNKNSKKNEMNLCVLNNSSKESPKFDESLSFFKNSSENDKELFSLSEEIIKQKKYSSTVYDGIGVNKDGFTSFEIPENKGFIGEKEFEKPDFKANGEIGEENEEMKPIDGFFVKKDFSYIGDGFEVQTINENANAPPKRCVV